MSGPRLDEFARPGDAWSRAYLGSDFCQTLLPAPSTMLEAFAALRGRAAFALVTPPVNDAGLHRVGVLLDLLAAETAPEAATEVVVNDWGVLGLDNSALNTWLAILALSLILGIGMSWSILRQRLSGQQTTDEVDG